MSLTVLSPGTFSLLVDAGRPHHRGLGIPVGGPADRRSLALGNALVGNPPFTCAMEITLTGPTFVADADVGLCVFGAPFQVERDGQPMEAGYTLTLYAGQTLRIGGTPAGCRAYLCVPGGFQVMSVLDSTTGFEPIRAGDLLVCEPSHLPGRGMARTEMWDRFVTGPDRSSGQVTNLSHEAGHEVSDGVSKLHGTLVLRCLPGPQADWFDDAFFTHEYRVTPASNRMGLRLHGPPLVMPKRELVSEPVAPGAVQITNEGQPIVLGVDGQTIGGYPKVAHVLTADLDALGQLRPGDLIRFARVSEGVAEATGAKWRNELRMWLRRIAASGNGMLREK